MNSATMMLVVLAAIAAGALLYAIFFDRINAEKTGQKRLDAIKKTTTSRAMMRSEREKANDAQKRRRTLQDNLDELDRRNKKQSKNQKNPPLRTLLAQAGLNWTVRQFYLISIASAFICFLLGLMAGVPLLMSPVIAIIGFFGVPRWIILHLRKKRMKAFLNDFPNALDVITRSLRSGLPLNDSLRLLANDAPSPVKEEFRRIIEAQQIGLTIPEAVAKMPENMPCPEANFFAIVIQIQSQAGGNLSEALGNLSRVLRDRKKMAAKVQAMSQEAKASAAIIVALPFLVATAISFMNPGYISTLFTTFPGNILLAISVVMYSLGIFVMKIMINFKM